MIIHTKNQHLTTDTLYRNGKGNGNHIYNFVDCCPSWLPSTPSYLLAVDQNYLFLRHLGRWILDLLFAVQISLNIICGNFENGRRTILAECPLLYRDTLNSRSLDYFSFRKGMNILIISCVCFLAVYSPKIVISKAYIWTFHGKRVNSFSVNLRFLRFKLLKKKKKNKNICNAFDHNFKNIPLYKMRKVSLKRYYFVLWCPYFKHVRNGA